MFRCEGLKVVTVEVFSTHPIWFSAFFSTPASPRLSFQLNFQRKSTHVYMWPFKGGDGWSFFNSSNLVFSLLFNSGQPMLKVEISIEFSNKILDSVGYKNQFIFYLENSIENSTLNMGWPDLKRRLKTKLDELKKPQPSLPLNPHI